MINPNSLMKSSYQNQQSMVSAKNISIEKISGLERTRWDAPIEVPNILYQKFKVTLPDAKGHNQVTSDNYPSTLLDFIRRAYARSKDNFQKKAIEEQIRDIIEKNKMNLNAINWDNYPIPNPPSTPIQQPLRSSTIPHQYTSINPSLGTIAPKILHKQTISLSSSMYSQSLIDKIQKPRHETLKPTKQKQMVSKRLQKLEQKYGQHDNAKNQTNKPSEPVKTFIGFKDQKQVRIQMLQEKYKIKEERNKINQQTRPEPPKLNSYDPRQSSRTKPLQVVQSKAPEKVYEVKKIPESAKISQKKQTKTPKITKKQFQNIVKVGQQQDLRTVAKRFTQFNKINQVKNVQVSEQVQEQDLDFKIMGKCKKIDKPYLRITHRPDPQTVRPEPILRKAFNHYKAEYQKGVFYDLIISQFRSIRQDITVQDIRNSFTVQVYEQNLKMSLYEEDPIQMKQCQTNLWQLYRQGLYNKRAERTKFISYHFISMILQERFKELEYMLTLIPPQVLQEKLIQQTLKVKRLLVTGNYNAFFNFYTAQDETCQKLMNHYVDKVRVKCLVMVCKTFGEKVSFKQLGQNIAEDQDVLEALAREQGATITDGCLILKESYEALKKSQYLQVKKVSSLLD